MAIASTAPLFIKCLRDFLHSRKSQKIEDFIPAKKQIFWKMCLFLTGGENATNFLRGVVI